MSNALPTLRSSNPNLTATYTDEQVIFSGGSAGDHNLWLSVSSPERIKAHWNGYCSNNDAEVVDSVGDLKVGKYAFFYARNKDRDGKVVALDLDKQEALVCALITQYSGTCRYYEYYVVSSSHSGFIRNHKPAQLPKKWQSKLKSVAVNTVKVLEKWDRRQGWVPATTAPKGMKRMTATRWVVAGA